VADSRGDLPSELRFKDPGWSFYGGGLAWSLLPAGVSALIWGGEALTFWGGPEFKLGILGELRGVFLGLLSAFVALGQRRLPDHGSPREWTRSHGSQRGTRKRAPRSVPRRRR